MLLLLREGTRRREGRILPDRRPTAVQRAVFIFDQVRLGFIPGVTYQLAAAGFVPLLITELCAAVTAEKQAGEKVSAAPAGVLGSSLKFSHGLIISLCVDNRLMESRIFFAVVDDHAGIRLPQKNLACETFVFQTEDLSDVGQGVSLQIQFIEAAHGLRVGVGDEDSSAAVVVVAEGDAGRRPARGRNGPVLSFPCGYA